MRNVPCHSGAVVRATIFVLLANLLLPMFGLGVHAPRTGLAGASAIGDVCSVRTPGRGVPNDAPVPVKSLAHGDHCPFCTSGVGPLIVDTRAGVLFLPRLAADPPPLFLHGPRPLAQWAVRRARGPPLPSLA